VTLGLFLRHLAVSTAHIADRCSGSRCRPEYTVSVDLLVYINPRAHKQGMPVGLTGGCKNYIGATDALADAARDR
jgi:hypothetical protein